MCSGGRPASKALETLDIDAISKHFGGMAKGQARDKVVDKHKSEKPNVALRKKTTIAKEPDTEQKPKKAGKQDRLDECVLVFESSPMEFVVGLVDRALQLRVHSLGSATDISTTIADFTDDATKVRQRLGERLPSAFEGVKSFGEVLGAVVTILRCSMPDQVPPPSEVREARLVFNTEDLSQDSFLLARAMSSHSGGKKIMERARQEAAVGMADDAADLQFHGLFDGLESSLALAFDDSIIAFAMSGDGKGVPHTMASFRKYFDIGRGAAVEFQMVLKAWSTSRLEQKLGEAATVIQTLLLVARVAMFVGAKSFELSLPQLPALAGVPGHVEQALRRDGDERSDVVDAPEGQLAAPVEPPPEPSTGDNAIGAAESIIDRSRPRHHA